MGKLSEAFYGERSAPPIYPDVPRFSETMTPRDAATAIERQAANLRDLVLAVLIEAGRFGLTADEVALRLNKSVLAIRPRLTELGPKHFGRLERTGERRRNASGLNAAVWRVRR